MWEPKTIAAYLETVATQIRWKRARPMVTLELAQHLEDQRDALAAEGYENAEELAVEEMGDPVAVGTELDRIHRPKPQWGLLALTVLLALAGAMLRIGLTANWAAYSLAVDPSKTILAFVFGCGALLFGYFIDAAFLGRHGNAIYWGTLLVSITALLLSQRVSGLFYYLRYVELCFPVIYGFWLYTCRKKGWLGLFLSMLGLIPLGVICLLTPHALGFLLVTLTGFVLLLIAAWNDWFALGRGKSIFTLLLGAFLLAVAVFCGVFFSDYTLQRLTVAFQPEQDPFGRGYLGLMIQQALGAAQWWGTGEVISAYPFALTVPGCESDAFLTTLIYQLGWFPFLMVVLGVTLLIGWLLWRYQKHKSQLGKVVILAVIMTLIIQALSSIAWNFGYTLCSAAFPLVIGNLNTVLNMWLIGLALSMLRGERICQDTAAEEITFLPGYRIKISVEKD